MPDPNAEVAANIRAELARKQATQTQLAAALKITQQSVSAKLNGKRPFTIAEVSEAADFLRVAPAVLYGEALAGRAA